jgi:hypothetical protein
LFVMLASEAAAMATCSMVPELGLAALVQQVLGLPTDPKPVPLAGQTSTAAARTATRAAFSTESREAK